MYALHDFGVWEIYYVSVKEVMVGGKKEACWLVGGLVSGRKTWATASRFVRWKEAPTPHLSPSCVQSLLEIGRVRLHRFSFDFWCTFCTEQHKHQDNQLTRHTIRKKMHRTELSNIRATYGTKENTENRVEQYKSNVRSGEHTRDDLARTASRTRASMRSVSCSFLKATGQKTKCLPGH